MGLFHRHATDWEPVPAVWPDEELEVDDREFAEAIATGRRLPETELANN